MTRGHMDLSLHWKPEQHPRRPDGEFTWASRVAGSVGGGSIFDSFVDPAFEDVPEGSTGHATQWAHQHWDYTDTTTGYRSQVWDVEHNGDGVTVRGSFSDGASNIGHWEFHVLHDESGRRVAAVEAIEVDENNRGEGLAKRWVHRLETALRAEGVREISLWDHSLGFWRSQGYRAGGQPNESVKTL